MNELKYEYFDDDEEYDNDDWHVLKERPSMKYEEWKYPTVSGESPPKQRDVGNVQVLFNPYDGRILSSCGRLSVNYWMKAGGWDATKKDEIPVACTPVAVARSSISELDKNIARRMKYIRLVGRRIEDLDYEIDELVRERKAIYEELLKIEKKKQRASQSVMPLSLANMENNEDDDMGEDATFTSIDDL